MSLWVFLPFISITAWTVASLTPESPPADDRDSPPLLRIVIGHAAGLVVVSEALSAVGWLARGPVVAVWGLAAAAGAFTAFRSGAWRVAGARLAEWGSRARRVEGVALVAVGAATLLVAGLLLTAMVSPPNTVDAMQYHLPRQLHWIQDQSLRPYVTAFEPQIYNPIWSELAGANLRLLAGGDGAANLVQWAGWAAAVYLAISLAGRLGAPGWAAGMAGAYFASLPIAVLESSGAKNDLVAAVWLLALAHYAVVAWNRGLTGVGWVEAGLAAGLGVLTKGTFLPFAIPLLFVLVLARWKQSRAGQIGGGVVAVAAGLALNAPHWMRNFGVYGSPIGPSALVTEKIGMSWNPAAILLQAIANLAQNLVVPWAAFRHMVESAVLNLFALFQLDPGGFRLGELWNHEDQAGNPLHLALAIAAIAFLLRRPALPARRFAAWALAVYLVFAAMIRYDTYGVRYQIPFFGLCAVAVGVAAGRVLRPAAQRWGVLVLLAAAVPWVVLNRTRPWVSWQPRTATASIFTASRWELLFANWQEREDPTRSAVEAILGLSCRAIGLRIDSHDWEYPFWSGLGAPESGFRLEILNPAPALVRLQDDTFRPCAIVCTICGGRTRLNGLARLGSWSDVVLYSGGTFVDDPDG